jgi:hypothetical protein
MVFQMFSTIVAIDVIYPAHGVNPFPPQSIAIYITKNAFILPKYTINLSI